MRQEPRWDPDSAEAEQLKAYFVGRILLTAKRYENNIHNDNLKHLLLSKEPDSLGSLYELLFAYLPGPLDGSEISQSIFPVEIEQEIETHLKTSKVDISSFIATINLAKFFNVGAMHAESVRELFETSVITKFPLSKIRINFF